MNGRFITLEGIDGAGKSTHASLLRARLTTSSHTVVQTREPGGTELATALRQLFLHQPMDGLTEALLVFAGRRDHLQKIIEPALAAGQTVICDRFTDATFAYQGAGRGMDAGILGALEQWVQEGRQPDLTLWFDLPPEQAARRRAAAREADRFEQQDLEFFSRVSAGYARRAALASERFVRVDATGSIEAVAAQIEVVLRARGW